MLCTADGTLWVGTRKGLFLLQTATESANTTTTALKAAFSPVPSVTAEVLTMQQDRFVPELLWLGCVGGVVLCYNTTSRQTTRYLPHILPQNPPQRRSKAALLPEMPIMDIDQDQQGRLWIANDDNGLLCFHPQTGVWRQFLHNPKDPMNPRAPSYNRIFSVAVEQEQNMLWVGTWGGGLNTMDLKTEIFISVLRNNPLKNTSIAANEIMDIFFDRENNLWAGTPIGVSVLTAQARRSGTFAPLMLSKTLDSNATITYSVSSVVVENATNDEHQSDKHQNAWISTANSVYRYCPAERRSQFIKMLVAPEHDSKRAYAITNFAFDRAGSVWAGTSDGLYRAANAQQSSKAHASKQIVFQHFGGIPHIKQNSFIRTVWGDDEGAIWISDDDTGLTIYYPASKTWRHIEQERPRGFASTRPLCFAGGRNQRGEYEVWFGGWRGGLQCYNTSTKRFRNYPHDPKNPRSLPVENIGALHIAWHQGKREIWFAPVNAGLCWFKNPDETLADTSKKAMFERFDASDGIPEGSIWGIVEQEATERSVAEDAAQSRTLWCATQRGILRFAPQSRATRLYGIADGLPSLEFLNCTKFRSGQMLFGSNNFIITFHPDSLNLSLPLPQVQIVGCNVHSQPRILTSGQQRGAEALEVQWWQNIVEFRFAAPVFAARDQTRYRYRLEGFETYWHSEESFTYSTMEARNKAVYSNLDAGEYTFVVQASLPDRTWCESSTARVRLVVMPPFWRTGWFLVAASTLGFAVFTLVIRYFSTLKLRRRLAVLEELNRERDRISQDVHDDVGLTLTRITLLVESLRYRPMEQSEHHLQYHLQAIADVARAATATLGEIIWAIKPVNDSLENFLAYTREYTLELFEESPMRCVVSLPELVPAVQLLPETRRNAFLVVKESLNNVLKHSGAASVRVVFAMEGTLLCIMIIDDGRGFNSQRTRPERSSGNGLVNMRRRVERIGGTFSIESSEGAGTRVMARIPLA
jgi:signal transduction histidine kinase/ligand-binding sensor domain-containing protein